MKFKGNVVDLNFFSLLEDVFAVPSVENRTTISSSEGPDEVPDVSQIVRRRAGALGARGGVRRAGIPTQAMGAHNQVTTAEGAIKIYPPLPQGPIEVEPNEHEKLITTINGLSARYLINVGNLEHEGEAEEIREQLLAYAVANDEDHLNGCVRRWQQSRYEALSEEQKNFSYGRNTTIAPSGRLSRIRANFTAISLLKTLERENRLPTSDEKGILAAYAGWGADKEVFNTNRAAYREYRKRFTDEQMAAIYPDYTSWELEYGSHYDQLKRELTEEEWVAAAHSTLNAHYTSEEVSHSLWDIAMRAGFKGGNVLEPAMGNGAIIGAMPGSIRGRAFVTGVELDSISARLAKKLYPEGRVHQGAFEHAKNVKPNSQDLVITNVPFSDVGPGAQSGPMEFNLHNFFISESLKKLRPGGLLVAVTSASTMQNNPKQIRELASRSELIGAIRLPSAAFAKRADTDVVTDIVVLRKPTSEKLGEETWTNSMPVLLDEDVRVQTAKGEEIKLALVNEYFVRHPEMVLGRHSLKGRMYGRTDRGQYMVEAQEGVDVAEALAAAVERLPEGFLSAQHGATPAADLVAEERGTLEKLYGSLSDKIGNYVLADGQVKVVSDQDLELCEPAWRAKDGMDTFKVPRGFDVKRLDELVTDFIGLREELKKQIATDLNPAATDRDSQSQRTRLKTSYESFTAKWGALNASPAIDRILASDPEWGAVLALENVRREHREGKAVDVFVPSKILTEKTLYPVQRPSKAGTISEAILISLSEMGCVDLPYIGRMIGSEDLDGVETMVLKSGLAFRNAESGVVESKEKYLSGNVVKKLKAAETAAALDPERYQKNVEALKDVQPRRIMFGEIFAELGSPWIPTEVLSRFSYDRLGQPPSFKPSYLWEVDQWVVPQNYVNAQKFREFSTPRKSEIEIFEAALNNQRVRVYKKIDETTSVFDEKASNLANDRVLALRESFVSFLKEDLKCQQILEEAFNEKYNHSTIPVYDGSYLKFPGISAAMTPRKAQSDVTARCLQEQCGIVAHDVGYGKTLSAIMMAYESKRMGLARKPLIACDNSNYVQFAATARQVYPQANILVSDEDSLSAKKRTAFLSRIATGNWDMIVMAHSHIDRIPNDASSLMKFFAESIEEKRAAVSALDAQEGKQSKKLTRQLEKAIEKESARLETMRKQMENNHDDCLTFQQLGVDLLLVDEIHKYKKLPFATSMTNVKGLDTGRSQRGTSMLIKAQSIQEQRNGKGVIGLTATPVTNTMAEVWNMVRLTNPNQLGEYNIRRFDQFASTFCRQITNLELNESNGKWREVTRLAKFVNGPTFIQFVRGSMDVKNDPTEANLILPKVKGGGPQLLTVELTDQVADIMDDIANIYSAYEKSPNRREISYVPIMLMQVGMAAAIDPRLVIPRATDDSDSLVNTVVRSVLERRQASDGKTQVIFCDRYRTMDTSILNELRNDGLAKADRLIQREDAEGTVVKDDGETVSETDTEEPVGIGSFNLYHDIRDKLIRGGYAPDKILIPGEAKTGDERAAMFDRANIEKDIVVIGSTTKIGVGCNFQQQLYAMWHLDPPRSMTPADLTQRNGRGIRQGNTCPEIEVYYCGMKDTVMPGVFDRISVKGRFVAQAMAGRGVGIEFEDAGALDLDQMKAGLISDKRVLLQAELRVAIKEAKTQLEVIMSRRSGLEADLERQTRYFRKIDESLPREKQIADAVKSTVVPPLTAGEVFFTTPDGTRYEGRNKEVVKELGNLVDAWKKIEVKDMSVLVKKLGRIVVNGMNVDVTKEVVGIADNRNVLVGKCHHEAAGFVGKEFTFGTPEAILKMVQSRFEMVLASPEQLQQDRENLLQSLRSTEQQIARCGDGKENQERTRSLSVDLIALEEKMRTEPYVRRRKHEVRGKAREETIMVLPEEMEEKRFEDSETVAFQAVV